MIVVPTPSLIRRSGFLQRNRVEVRHYFLLLLLCILAYWPLSFGVFSVKNDAIHYFLPYRVQISDALHHGYAPFWNPYIYLGNPVMGDMQSGAWNPFVWFFSLFGRYDITVFHIENLLYIFLGGIGMYKLTDRLIHHSSGSWLIAAAYMLSGFMLGGQLINWLAAAAFLPFVLHYYLRLLREGRNTDVVKTAISLYLLFSAGYPSFFILTAYLLVLLFVLELITRIRQHRFSSRFVVQQVMVFFLFAGLSLPAIIAYADLLPYYHRGAGTSYAEAIANAFEWQHLRTLVFPFSIKANDLVTSTDLTCRNVFVGLLPLLLLVVTPPPKNRRTLLLVLLALFSLLFSLGDATPIRKWCFDWIPLLDTFRHPSQVRLFFILAILLLAAPAVKKILADEYTALQWQRLRTLFLMAFVLVLLITAFAFYRSNILQQTGAIRSNGIRGFLKACFDSVSLYDSIAVNGLLQAIFLLIFYFALRPNHKRWQSWFFTGWILNLFIMAQLVLPASFVGSTAPANINAILHASPKGYPVTGLNSSLDSNSRDAFSNYETAGLSFFYSKKIGISRITNSPAFLSRLDSFVQTRRLYYYVASKPVVYLADTVVAVKDTSILDQTSPRSIAFSDLPIVLPAANAGSSTQITSIHPNRIDIQTHATTTSLLVLTQNDYHYWRATVDGTGASIIPVNGSFMSVAVPGGDHTVRFHFVPTPVIMAMWVQLFVIIGLLVFGGYYFYHQKRKQA